MGECTISLGDELGGFADTMTSLIDEWWQKIGLAALILIAAYIIISWVLPIAGYAITGPPQIVPANQNPSIIIATPTPPPVVIITPAPTPTPSPTPVPLGDYKLGWVWDNVQEYYYMGHAYDVKMTIRNTGNDTLRYLRYYVDVYMGILGRDGKQYIGNYTCDCNDFLLKPGETHTFTRTIVIPRELPSYVTETSGDTSSSYRLVLKVYSLDGQLVMTRTYEPVRVYYTLE